MTTTEGEKGSPHLAHLADPATARPPPSTSRLYDPDPLKSCGEATTNAAQLFRKYGNYKEGEKPWEKYGRANDWNIDLVPKLLMANGELTSILVSTDVTKYLEFRQIAGSFVQQSNGPKATVAKVPSTAGEALSSPLMGLFEKRRAKKFLEWVGSFNESDPATFNGVSSELLGGSCAYNANRT